MPISDAFKADIEEGQRLRGWIANSYAQIEFLLGDLIHRCQMFSEYYSDTKTFPHSAPKRTQKVRRLLQQKGPLSRFAAELTSVINRFEERHETRNLLAHGFCEYLYTAGGDAGFRFQKWHYQEDRDNARLERTFRLSDLREEKANFVSLASDALHLFMRIHDQLGWTGL